MQSLQRELHSLSHWIEFQAPYSSETSLAGVDEVGRGPLAGPVIAAACHFSGPVLVDSIQDSKKLSSKKRAFIASQLLSHPHVHVGFGLVTAQEIDAINIHQATLKAMVLAVEDLKPTPSFLFIDGIHYPPLNQPGLTLKQGESKSRLIAAASILAKERRDALMRSYALTYPHYGFEVHMGYGTAKHRAALEKWGPCPIHRMSFSPLNKENLKT